MHLPGFACYSSICANKTNLDSKVDLLDEPEVVARKIRKAECAPMVTDGNGVLAFVQSVLLPAAALKGQAFQVDRDRDGLEPLVYTSIDDLHEDYRNNLVSLVSIPCTTPPLQSTNPRVFHDR